MKLRFDGNGPLYEQLARALKRAILQGEFSARNRLPGTRALATLQGVSRNTVLGAYEILCAEQLATTQERSRTRVNRRAESMQDVRAAKTIKAPSRYSARIRKLQPNALGRLRPPPRYDLHYGEPLSDPHLLHSWRRRLAAATSLAGPGYPDARGFLPLRRAISEYLVRRRGVVCTEQDVLIVGGTQQAVTLVARVVLNEGDVAAIEEPHYQHVMQILKAHGARIASIPTDSNGLITSALIKHRARLICVTPSHQFPTGSILSLERRLDLLRIASLQGSWILEDDYDSEFQYRSHPIAALRSLDVSGRVIYVGSFSKTLFPSLRLGYIVCPPALRDDLFMTKRLDDLGSPAIEQAALATFIQSRQFDKHLRKAARELECRRDILLEGLQRHAANRVEIQGEKAGVHIVVWFRRMTYPQLQKMIELGIERGLGLYPMHPHYRKPPTRPGLLLGYAGLSPHSLKQACEIFGKCLTDSLNSR